MVLGRKKFGTVVVAVGIVLLLAGLLAVPGWAQQTSDVDQYADEAVCQAVINIIVDNSQNSSQSNISQTDQYDSDDINNIAQELNISPSIVQECVEGNAGGGDDGTTNDNGTTNDDGTIGEDTEGPDAVIDDSEVDGSLPETGGLEIVWTGGALLMGAGLVMWRMVSRRS